MRLGRFRDGTLVGAARWHIRKIKHSIFSDVRYTKQTFLFQWWSDSGSIVSKDLKRFEDLT